MPVWLRAAAFVLLVPGAIAGWLPWYIAGSPRLTTGDDDSLLRWLGGLLVLAGWAVLLWCARDFARRGRGTPAPYDPPRALVTSGLYRIVRNPMYVGAVTAIVGQALWHRSGGVLVYGGAVALMFHLRVVLAEEPRLAHSFGSEYADYCARVPRWIPRLRHGRASRPST